MRAGLPLAHRRSKRQSKVHEIEERVAMTEPTKRGVHDLGGLPAGPVPRAEHELAFWEKRVDATLQLLARKRLMTVDELRRGIESLPPEDYDRMSYYERWTASIARIMVEHGVVTQRELDERVAALDARAKAAGR
jgi:nitrile hydratase subunit beta